MPTGLEQLEQAQAEFNRRYGVSFDVDEFDGSIRTLDEDGDGTSADEIYRTTFASLYKKAYANFVDRRIGDEFDFMGMLNEFEKEVMTPYRQHYVEPNEAAPKPFGGWKASEYLESVDTFLNDIPILKESYAEERYRNGKLRIRDMRKHVNELKAKENPTLGELSSVDCYITALYRVSNNRSLVSKILHPFRYFAEQRELKSFTAYLEEKTGGPLLLDGNNPNAMYRQITDISGDMVIGNSRDAIRDAKAQALASEQGREAVDEGKEKLSFDDEHFHDNSLRSNDWINELDPIGKSNNLEV